MSGRRAFAAAALAAWLAVPGAKAEPAACSADGAETGVVREVGEDLSLGLIDGRQLRLPGIEPVRDTPDRPAASAAARTSLAGWLNGQTVGVRPAGPPDRWNRIAALVFAPVSPGGASLAVAVALADAGLARARPEGVLSGCAAEILRAEASARAAKLGLWADPYYAVRAASDGPALLALAGEWVVVEGRVAHVGRTRTATFLDLDARRGGLSLRLSKGLASFTPGQGATGQNDWVGRRVRARGVLEDRGGPQLEIRDPAQIELLAEPGQPATLGGAGNAGN